MTPRVYTRTNPSKEHTPMAGEVATQTQTQTETKPLSKTGSLSDLDWLLGGLVQRVPYTRAAVLLTNDGLVTCVHGLDSDSADHMAALASGLYSLGRSAGARFGDGAEVRQVVVELDTALVFVSAAGSGTCLAVLADREADAGVLGYEMAMLVKSVRPYLAAPPRRPVADAEAGR
ncbi:putative regulator of Ras-like GTPase activity (Roadblock/LC7/MglB family) [Streptomyces sp. 3211.6]|nr:putative regulator of Ras-like GTPase activity (Roadblock/LC7/MglB family) [Streptomyces sp. 3211.6]